MSNTWTPPGVGSESEGREADKTVWGGGRRSVEGRDGVADGRGWWWSGLGRGDGSHVDHGGPSVTRDGQWSSRTRLAVPWGRRRTFRMGRSVVGGEADSPGRSSSRWSSVKEFDGWALRPPFGSGTGLSTLLGPCLRLLVPVFDYGLLSVFGSPPLCPPVSVSGSLSRSSHVHTQT